MHADESRVLPHAAIMRNHTSMHALLLFQQPAMPYILQISH